MVESRDALVERLHAVLRARDEARTVASFADCRDVRGDLLRGEHGFDAAITAWARRLGAAGRLDAAEREFAEMRERLRRRVTEVAEQQRALRHRAEPQPLPGSREWETLAGEVRRLESEAGEIDEALRALDSQLMQYESADGLLERARRGEAIIAAELVRMQYDRAVAQSASAIDKFASHNADVLVPLTGAEEFVTMLSARIGQPLVSPVVVFPDRVAWEAIALRRHPEYRLPEPTAPAGEPAMSSTGDTTEEPTKRGRLARLVGRGAA
jgi:hypothetical protein